MTFYGTQIISLLLSPRDREFRKMMCHHVLTTAAAILTWLISLTIPFVLIVTVFDTVDILLPLCKLTGYAKYNKASDFISIIFALVWILTRVFYYWYWSYNFCVIFVLVYGLNIINLTCIIIILSLAILNLIWTWYILKMLKFRVYQRKIVYDVRSSESEGE